MEAFRHSVPGGRGECHEPQAIRPDDGLMSDLSAQREGTRHTLAYGEYRLSYEVYGSGDRVLVWLHGLLLDANLSRGLILEMPVLESAIPAAALVFLPLLLQVHYARTPLRWVSRAAARLPAARFGPVGSFISATAAGPDAIAAVLHGVLVGPIAPTVDERQGITAPALVLGHGIDLIHSFTDARRLARQLPNARLIRTRTFAELWVSPARLTAEISEFLDRVWGLAQPTKAA